ncbi:MAG: UDP-phosphate galactose phosphotransferase [Azospirillum brasilense]|uniref:sugar transferase n=2 Tax=Roseomonadaceae TaxID=3385906 RepID=UPI000C198083|nr:MULTISPECIES: sugar transferase [Roseomonas]ATR19591.1 UDP-phosphate galactose phosphotransferase [Roseomonas sp. FDAARGOS_362]MDT8351780.1 sugar transferase [Roseomonas mucosa]PZP39448.1 MAG: UDP-phosphate galactose phosphotransferase [Azospirillum brasilense]
MIANANQTESRADVFLHRSMQDPAIATTSGSHSIAYPAMRLPRLQNGFYVNLGRPFLKRSTDIGLSLVMLVLALPIMAFIALLVSLDRGPIFYAHPRIARNGRTFGCLKFRSMVPDAEKRLQNLLASDPEIRHEWETQQKLRRDPRVTWIGRVLRATSLDEVPQLFNVLRGDMSLVGPRPVTQKELVERYSDGKSVYLSVRPGLTGLWQVSGRSDTSYAYRITLDTQYVLRPSMRTDMKILVKTVKVVLRGSGAV